MISIGKATNRQTSLGLGYIKSYTRSDKRGDRSLLESCEKIHPQNNITAWAVSMTDNSGYLVSKERTCRHM